jgi:hypothetical protein
MACIGDVDRIVVEKEEKKAKRKEEKEIGRKKSKIEEKKKYHLPEKIYRDLSLRGPSSLEGGRPD